MTIRSFLVANFGNADDINGLDHWGDTEISGAHFLLAGGPLLQAHVGGGIGIIGFKPTSRSRRALYLVVDDSDGRLWDSKFARKSGAKPPRPSPMLCLVQSA